MKKSIMFSTQSLGLCVCVCVCVCVSRGLSVCQMIVTRWLDLATCYCVMLILLTRTRKTSISQDDQFPFPFHIEHPDIITFWPITSKLTVEFTPNLTLCISA